MKTLLDMKPQSSKLIWLNYSYLKILKFKNLLYLFHELFFARLISGFK